MKLQPTIREVQVLGGPTSTPAVKAGLPGEVPEGYIRVYARANVLGIAANHWGDVKIGRRHLEECLRKHLVLLEDELGNPAPAKLEPRTCCGYSQPGQH